tara:strand:+ start:1494 stop:1865 length:372 start_codon:yes stop_codon:yes gene_type:complete
MPFFNTEVYDQGLDWVDTNGTRVDICFTAEPTTYAEATSTQSCGNKTGLNTGAPAPGAIDGRSVTVPAITDGSVTATQTAGWWGLTDGATLLVATGSLSATQAVTSGNTFTLDAIVLTIRAPT